jgi:uncharacterized membrane protein
MQLHLIRGSSVASCFVATLRLGEQNCSLRMLSYKTHKGCIISVRSERKKGKVRNWRERRLQGRLRGAMSRSTRRLYCRQPE